MESGFLKQNRSFKGKDRKRGQGGGSQLGCKVVEEGERGNGGGGENNKMSQEAKHAGGGWWWWSGGEYILMLSPFNLPPCKHTELA